MTSTAPTLLPAAPRTPPSTTTSIDANPLSATRTSPSAAPPLPLTPQSRGRSLRRSSVSSGLGSSMASAATTPPQSPFIKSTGQIDEDKLKRYKAQMCPRGDSCQLGVMCDFAHSRDELRRPLSVGYAPVLCTIPGCRDAQCKFSHNLCESQYHPEVYKTKLCSYWNKDGTCQRGAYCSFAHGQEELKAKKRPSITGSPTPRSTPLFTPRSINTDDQFANFLAKRGIDESRSRRHSSDSVNQHRLGLASTTVATTSSSRAEAKKDLFDADLRLRMLDLLDEAQMKTSEVTTKTKESEPDDEQEEVIEPFDDQLDEALAVLTGDRDRLLSYSLTPLKKLRALLRDASEAVDEVIRSYEASHPHSNCLECSAAPVGALLVPCYHATVCQRCSERVHACPHCHARVEERRVIEHELPSYLFPTEELTAAQAAVGGIKL